LNLTDRLPVLTVLGGSKGARSINQAVFKALPTLLETMQVVHLTGQLDWESAKTVLRQLPEPVRLNYHPYAYLHEEIGATLAAASLVLSRAGASTLGELPLFGTPAILVPYPYAWRYQHVNADYLVRRGAAILVKDADLPGQILALVQGLISDPGRLSTMRDAMAVLAKPRAATDIANLLTGMAPDSGK